MLCLTLHLATSLCDTSHQLYCMFCLYRSLADMHMATHNWTTLYSTPHSSYSNATFIIYVCQSLWSTDCIMLLRFLASDSLCQDLIVCNWTGIFFNSHTSNFLFSYSIVHIIIFTIMSNTKCFTSLHEPLCYSSSLPPLNDRLRGCTHVITLRLC